MMGILSKEKKNSGIFNKSGRVQILAAFFSRKDVFMGFLSEQSSILLPYEITEHTKAKNYNRKQYELCYADALRRLKLLAKKNNKIGYIKGNWKHETIVDVKT